MLERITKSDYGEITLAILNDTRKGKLSWVSKFNNKIDKLLYRSLLKLEDMKYNPSHRAFETMDLKILLSKIHTLKIKPRQTTLVYLVGSLGAEPTPGSYPPYSM